MMTKVRYKLNKEVFYQCFPDATINGAFLCIYGIEIYAQKYAIWQILRSY